MKSIVVFVTLLAAIQIIDGIKTYRAAGTGLEYFIGYPMTKTWHEALRFCRFHKMYLLTINTSEENSAVLQIIKKTAPSTVHFWTSGTDLGIASREWYWMETGGPVWYTNWIPGYPKTASNHCILLHGGVHHYKWYDQVCNAKHHFVCQNRLTWLKRVDLPCQNCVAIN